MFKDFISDFMQINEETVNSQLSEFLSKNINEQAEILKRTVKSYYNDMTFKNNSLGSRGIIKEVIISLNNLMYEIENETELFTKVIEKGINTISGADAGSLLILEEGNILEFKASVGFDQDLLSSTYLRLDESYLWKESNGLVDRSYVVSRKEKFDSEVRDNDNYRKVKSAGREKYYSTITSPIWIEGRLFGIINFDGVSHNAFSADDLDLLDYFSSQIGMIIKNHKQIEKAIFRSRYDVLTGIHNRSFFEEILNITMKQQIRQNIRFQMVLFDLDNFKEVNDSYGHIFGDKILKYFVNVVNDHRRESDLFARYGGDEFVAVFFITSVSDVIKIVEKIENHLNTKPYRERSVEVYLKFSYGISSFPDEAVTYADLVYLADVKMYRNKKKKKFVT